MNTGAYIKKSSIEAYGYWDKIWIWTYSPYSRYFYPWKGNQFAAKINLTSYMSIQGHLQILESILKDIEEGYWDKGKADINFHGDANIDKTHAQWQFSTGIRHYALSLDSLLSTTNRTSFPMKIGLKSSRTFFDSAFIAETQGMLHYENRSYFITGSVHGRERFLGIKLLQQCRAYYWNPQTIWSPMVERILPDSSATTEFSPRNHHRGINLEIGISKKKTGLSLEAYSGVSWEWEVTSFSIENTHNHNHTEIRTGETTVLNKPLMSTSHSLQFKHQLFPYTFY